MKKILLILTLLISVLKTEAQSSVFSIVDSLLLKGNYQKALLILDEAPKTVLVLDKIGAIYQTTGNYNKAISYYLEALEIEPNESIKVKLGDSYNSAGLNNNALSIFEEIIEQDSLNLIVANSLAKLYVSKKQPKKAEQIYRHLKKCDSLNPEYPYRLAQTLEKQDEFYSMGDNYLEAYNIDTLHIKSIYGLAKFFKKLRYKDSTMLFIDKGLQIDSLNTNFLQLKANELYFSKQFEKAIVQLNKLDSLNFRSVTTYEMFGMCYYNLGEFELAEKQFNNALKINRNDSPILYRLATLYYDKENSKLAKFYLMRSISAGKGELDKQYYLRGIIAKEEKELKQAVTYFEKSCSYNYKNYKALFELALASDIYYKDKKISLKYFERFIERFKSKDKLMTTYATNRIKEIKKELFMEGIKVE